jgi:SAM-dependent methyltransferase
MSPPKRPLEQILAEHNAMEASGAPQRYGAWMGVNCVIDPRDDIFRFFYNHPLACNPVREYLADGWRTLSELMLLMDAIDRPLTRVRSMLEFAAGFGRFTRHLAPLLPGRLTCSDLHPGSVDFLRERFGVAVFESADDPAKLAIPERYELVFVLSLFTHLPPAAWGAWLARLYAAVAPGGHLVLSVHSEEAAALQGVTLGADGSFFLAMSESTALDRDIYGTTFTTRAFVEREVERALARRPALYREKAFWNGQDAVVVRRPRGFWG